MARRGERGRGRGAALFAGAVVLVAAFLGWLATGTDPSANPARTAAAAPERDVARDAELRGIDVAEGAAPGRVEVAPTPAAEAGDAALGKAPELPLATPLADGVPVRVVRGRTDEPVPFAVVTQGERTWWLAGETRMEHQAAGGSLAEELIDARRWEADEHGELFLPPARQQAIAYGEKDGLWGWIEYGTLTGADSLLLRLFPDGGVGVRVTSAADGAPLAGVDVALRYQTSPEDVSTLDTVTSDSNGMARFDHFRQYLDWYWEHTESLYVEPAGIYAPQPRVRVEADALPELVELVLPESTGLDVTVLRHDGRVADQPVLVELASPDDPRLGVAQLARDGRASFERLGPGIELRITGEADDHSEVEPRTARTAPRPGERVAVTVELSEPTPGLVGRIRWPDGAAAAGIRVQMQARDPATNRREGRWTLLDDEGAFRLRLPPFLLAADQLEVHVLTTEEEPVLGAIATCAGPIEADRDLGELRLAPPPLLVSGRIVDDRGAPLAGARVFLGWSAATDSLVFASPRTDADGRFSAYGRTTARELSLSARLTRHTLVESPTVPVGARDVTLVMTGAGGIAGSILLDEEWFCDFMTCQARRSGTEVWTQSAWIQRPGFFAYETLDPGAWDVRIAMDDELEAGILVERVEVKAGEVTRDPRLAEVDLRAKARFVTFRVVDELGAPIEEGEIVHRSPDASETPGWSDPTEFGDGTAHVFTLLDELDVLAYAEGRRAELVPRARPGAEIVLGPGIPVRLYWGEEPAAVTATVRAYPQLLYQEPWTPLPAVAIQIDADPDAVSYLPVAGAYVLTWTVVEQAEGRSTSEVVAREPLVFLDRTEPVDVAVSMPAEVRARLGAE